MDEVYSEILKKLEKIEKKIEELESKIADIEDVLRKEKILPSIPEVKKEVEKAFESVEERKIKYFFRKVKKEKVRKLEEEKEKVEGGVPTLKEKVKAFAETPKEALKEDEKREAISKEKIDVIEEPPREKVQEKPIYAPTIEQELPQSPQYEEPSEEVESEYPEESELDLQHKPRDLEFTIGTSIFQRLGLLFIIVSSVFVTYWVYSEIIVQLSIFVKVLVVLSFGLLITLIGVYFVTSSFPRWYGEGLTSSGIAIIFLTTLISYYHLKVMGFYETVALMSSAFLLDVFLANRFKLWGLIIESLGGAILVGFIVAWGFPNYPYSQMYAVVLFIFLFLRLQHEQRSNLKIMLASYSLIGVVSIIQRVALYLKALEPHYSLQLIATLTPIVIYLSYESQEGINRPLNSYVSMFLMVVNAVIFDLPTIYFVASAFLFMAASFIAHKISNPELDAKYFISEMLLYVLAWTFITAYIIARLTIYNFVENPLIAYSGLGFIFFEILKIKFERKKYAIRGEELFKAKFEELTFLIYFFGIGIGIALGVFESNFVLFIPITIYLLMNLMGVDNSINNLLSFASYLMVLAALKTVNTYMLLISYLVLFSFYLYKRDWGSPEDLDVLSLLFVGFTSTGVVLRLALSDFKIFILAPLYLYTIYSIKENKSHGRDNIKERVFKIYPMIITYLLFITAIFAIPIYVIPLLVSVVFIYAAYNFYGETSNLNDYPALLMPFVLFYLNNVNYGMDVNLLASALFISSYTLRIFFYKHRGIKVEFYDFYITSAISASLIYLISAANNLLTISTAFVLATLNILFGNVSKSQLHQALSNYVYVGLLTFVLSGLTLVNLKIVYLLYLYIFAIYLLENFFKFNEGLMDANMLGFPVALLIIVHEGSPILSLLVAILVPILIGYQLTTTKKELLEQFPTYSLPKFVYYVSILAAPLLVQQIYSIPIYISNVFLLVYLSKLKVLNDFESTVITIYSNLYIFYLELIALGFISVIVLILIYLNFMIFLKTDWINFSKETALFLFPYQITYGYFSIFHSLPYINYVALATVAILAITVPYYKAGLFPAINYVAALTLIGFTQNDPVLVSTLLVIYIVTYSISALEDHPVLLLTLMIPLAIFTYFNQVFPPIMAVYGIDYIFVGTLYNYIKEGAEKDSRWKALLDIFANPLWNVSLAYGLFIYTIIIYGLDVVIWSATFFAAVFAISFIVDFAEDFKFVSHYAFISSLALTVLVIYQFGLKIETTAFVSLVAVITIFSGALTDRSQNRKLGVLTLLAASFKGVADIFNYLTSSNISVFLKIALGFLAIGFLLLATSYLYLKVYPGKESIWKKYKKYHGTPQPKSK
ncbi:MAG: hypothetical protein ACP6IP_02565 [Candidatus Njordarchaeia archaeon]